jgi:hypothetical protein
VSPRPRTVAEREREYQRGFDDGYENGRPPMIGVALLMCVCLAIGLGIGLVL